MNHILKLFAIPDAMCDELKFALILQPVWTEWGHYGTDLFTEKAVNIINGHDVSKPLFIYLAHQAVHNANRHQSIQAPSDVIKTFSGIKNERRRIYAAMATVLDQSVGKVINPSILCLWIIDERPQSN